MSSVQEVFSQMVSPLVQSGVVKEEDIGIATAALEKTQTQEPLTTSEKEVVEKMAQHLEKEKKKESIMRFVIPIAISYKILRWIT